MFLRRNWSSACSAYMLVGVGLNIPQTFGASGFHLILLLGQSLLNCKYCSWIKYEETSGFTGDICFSLKQPLPLIMKGQNLRDVRWHAAGTLIIKVHKSIWYWQLTFSWPFTQFPFQVRNVIIWSTIFVQLNKPCYRILGYSNKVINVFLYYFWTHDFWSNTLSYSVPFFSIPTISNQQNIK